MGTTPAAEVDITIEATWRRAEGWALVMASAVMLSSDDSPVLCRIAQESMTELLG